MHTAEQKRRTLLKDFHDTWTSVHQIHIVFTLLSTVLVPSLQRYPPLFSVKLYSASHNVLSISFVFHVYSTSFQSIFPLLLILSFISAPFLLSNLYSAAGFENSMIVQGFTYADIASPRQLTLHMHAHTQNTPLKQSFLPPLLLP